MLNPPSLDQQEYHQFRTLNQQVLAELMTFIDFAEEFTLGFIEINFPPNIDMLVKALRNDPKCQDIQFEMLDFSHRPDLRFLRDEILQQLPDQPRTPTDKFVLLIKGLEKSIGIDMDGEYPPVLQDLNYVRDSYKRSFPFPVLIVLPDYAITRLAKFAADFWAWRSGVFLFQTPPATRDHVLIRSMEMGNDTRLPSRPESQERIEMLEGLLMESSPSPGHPVTAIDLVTHNMLLYQLGVAYLDQHKASKAESYLQKALEMANRRMDPLLQAEISFYLGRALLEQRQFVDAQTRLVEALEIYEQAGDVHSSATIYHNLGIVAQKQRQYEEAEHYYRKALEIYEKFGDVYSSADTHHNLGMVAQEQDQYEQAEHYYHKALEIYEQAGDVHGTADTYHNLGIVAEDQKQYEQAGRYYRKALEIYEQAGDIYSSASTYHQLGSVAQEQRNFAAAFPYFLKSFQILLEFEDHYSALTYPFRGFVEIFQTQGSETFAQLWQDSTGDPCPDWILEEIQQAIQAQSTAE